MRFVRKMCEPVPLGALVALVMVFVWLLSALAFGTQLAFWRPADDAYYYYDIVRSTWTGLGVSTDGIHTTSGFHPLWYLVLLPFGAVFDAPDAALVSVAQILGMLLLGAAVAGIARALQLLRLGTIACVLGALTLTFAPWRGIASAGVEGALALALLSWFLVALLHLLSTQSRRWMLLAGVLAGLAVLARLDTVMVVGSMLLFTIFGPLRPSLTSTVGRRGIALLLGAPIVLVGGYLLVNVLVSGSPMPVTASLKSSFPEPNLSTAFLRSHIEYYLALAFAWVGLLVYRRSPERVVLAGLTVGATFFGGYEALFGRGVFWWHFVSLVPAGAVGAGVTLDWVLRQVTSRPVRRAVEIGSVALAAVIVLVPLASSIVEEYPNGDSTSDTGWRIEAERAGQWANDHLPSDALLGMTSSGAFGYYTDQALMNLDGLISDRAFNDAICDGTALEEMEKTGVKYVAQHRAPNDYTTFPLGLPCWEEGTTPTRLNFTPDDEVYRSQPYWQGGPDKVFVIWKFDPATLREG